MSARARRASVVVAGGALTVAFVALLPRWVSDFRARELALAGVFFIAILGLNIVTGYTGQISLGHGALMAIGGYTTAILVRDHGVQDVWTLPMAGRVTAAAGLLVGIPALRLSGLYLALATFALAVAMPSIIRRWDGLTGGSEGINLFEQGLMNLTGALTGTVTVLGRELTLNDWFYYLTWTIAALMLVLAWAITAGRLGRAFRAVRDSEIAAASSGVNLAAYKTLAFAISGFYAGVAGALFAIIKEFVNPLSFFFDLSILLLVGAVVGGLGSLAGVVFGALFIQFLPTISQHVSKSPGVPSVLYGVLIVFVMIVLPTGAGGLLRRVFEPLTSRLYTRP